jgi:hypothetical protein
MRKQITTLDLQGLGSSLPIRQRRDQNDKRYFSEVTDKYYADVQKNLAT